MIESDSNPTVIDQNNQPAEYSTSPSGNWRFQISKPRKRPIRIWFWSGAILVFLMLVVGGITRLTHSGLSMVNWEPIMGIIPPMNHVQWLDAFNQYKQFPEYQQLNVGMTLSEFKSIFFWEYLHRLIARTIGLVFIIPFAWFWISGKFNKALKKRSLYLLGLGAFQGLMGWIMVKSGLVNKPYVSHYRLTMHLILAFTIFAFCVWFALDLHLKDRIKKIGKDTFTSLTRWSRSIGALIIIQVIWGGYVAGLKAGKIFNTFPKMNGSWIPQHFTSLKPWILNFFQNPTTVQWTHRLIGTILGAVIILFWVRNLTLELDKKTMRLTSVLLGVVLVQYLLGVLTLLYHVPVVLGVLHQATAMILWGSWLLFYHHLKNGVQAEGNR